MPARKLNITNCKVAAQGTNQSTGKAWTIYEIEARDADSGILVNQSLRSFSELPLGVGEYNIDKYEKDGRVSYTLSKPGGGGGGAGLGRKVDDIAERLGFVEETVRIMQANLQSMTAVLDALVKGGDANTKVAVGGPPPVPFDDDDIPF